MALIVEDGSGVAGADAYASLGDVEAYWSARSHDVRGTDWIGANEDVQEGTIREATAFLDAVYGPFYRGRRASYAQGLLWPRDEGLDDAGDPLPVLDPNGVALPPIPPQLVAATAELAARALAARLAPDADRTGAVKRISEAVGPLKTDLEYEGGSNASPTHGAVHGLMAPLCDGRQPGGLGASWLWR